jgi:glycosyltransferase involved in cell wall biosynthesis
MNGSTRVLVVSSVPPKATGFGEMILHRHLADEPRLAVTVAPEPVRPRLVRGLRRSPVGAGFLAWEVWAAGRRWDRVALELAVAEKPDVILTVAHGDGAPAAVRLSQRTGIPLVTIYHDWWPDSPAAVGWAHSAAERQFGAWYRASKIALCVTEGMRGALGPHPDSRILPPISRRSPAQQATFTANPKTEKFRLRYAGNLREYAPMIRAVIEALEDSPELEFQARGRSPAWPEGFHATARKNGAWLDYASGEELENWLHSADALLITMPFDGKLRRQAGTAFPSKLTEYARFGRPLVVWAPEYATPVVWGRSNRRALCVTENDPAKLLAAVQRLAADATEQRRLGALALAAAGEEFDPVAIQESFVAALQTAACRGASVMSEHAPTPVISNPCPQP